MTEPKSTTPTGFWQELWGVVRRARDVWFLIGPHDRRRLALTLIPMLLTAAASNGVPLLLSQMVNELTISRDQGTMAQHWSAIALKFVGLIALISLIAEVLLVVRKYFVNRVCTRIERNLNVGLMSHLFKESLQTLSREQIGVLHGRAVRGVEGFIMFLKLGFKEFFPLVFSVSTALAYGFYRSWMVGLLMLAGLVLTILIAARQLKSQKGMHLALVRSRSKMDGKMIEQLEGIEYIRAANTMGIELDQVGRVADQRLESDTRLTMNGATFDAIKSLNDWAISLAVLALSVDLAVSGRISIGDIIGLVGLYANMARPLRDLHRIIDDAYEVSFHLEDLMDIMDEVADPSFEVMPGTLPTLIRQFDKLRPQTAPVLFNEPNFDLEEPLFSAKHITVEYQIEDDRRHRVLDDVSLDIERGEVIGFAGPSGSGKSTLLKVMMRLTHPAAGSAMLGGVLIENVSRDAIGRKIGYVGQNPYVFSGTIAENIVYGTGVSPTDRDRIRLAAENAYMHDEITAMADGYQTVLHQRGQNLSGGQRQRIALARAFLKDAPLLVLDEGTSALDNISEHCVQQAIERLWKGRTVIMVAHRLTTLRSANRIVVFQHGRIVQIGSMDELSTREGVFQELLKNSREH